VEYLREKGLGERYKFYLLGDYVTGYKDIARTLEEGL